MHLQIELQDIIDAKANDQESPHQKMAVEVIRNGGSVSFTKNGTPIGIANTIEELAKNLASL